MGTRFFDEIQPENNGDHPHAYGDKGSLDIERLNELGSSPRVWGQVRRYVQPTASDGIIPTRMGTRI